MLQFVSLCRSVRFGRYRHWPLVEVDVDSSRTAVGPDGTGTRVDENILDNNSSRESAGRPISVAFVQCESGTEITLIEIRSAAYQLKRGSS